MSNLRFEMLHHYKRDQWRRRTKHERTIRRKICKNLHLFNAKSKNTLHKSEEGV